ncbi:aminodeoxychorismate/anthranilate synthase component II [Buchnera aphidicola]|uniref:aminodeoxychorismate/anthranilate synthase component II n=1 Tax=Buchnera aphidicola TaxID=9 RepID=UPI00223818C5|nr:aminodeoxychorismate/anthranilate synthase component II [Buchnera aphidicola]MCW5197442.1 aminodeoxychorismate/anthranilate synthase component II [Buchnera aphidicola (Chaitophorus viminalis)]
MSEILLLDNFDSFLYNLVDLLRKNSNQVTIYRNNVSISEIIKKISNMKNPILILSPGPGNPTQAGCMIELISILKNKIPILGICLGYQAIIQSYGGKICYAKKILHGQSSIIYHDEKKMFYNIKNPIQVARYHSLICKNIPKNFIINAKKKNIAMSVRDNVSKICGFQFHPESILTTVGEKILKNTIKWMNT